MSIPRFYVGDLTLEIGKPITVTNDVAHHALRVLRLEVGDEIIVFNQQGVECQGKIIAVQAKKSLIDIQLTHVLQLNRESPLHIHLAQSIARGEKMDWIIQKAVELGVHTITPIVSEFGNVQLSSERMNSKLEHWQKVAISACEQCGRTLIPKINTPQTFLNFVANTNAEVKLLLHPSAVNFRSSLNLYTSAQTFCLEQVFQPKDVLAMTDKNILVMVGKNILAMGSKNVLVMRDKNVLVMVGPEGGFSDQELHAALQNNFKLWQLGPRILRTETAGLTAISILQYHWGDLSAASKL